MRTTASWVAVTVASMFLAGCASGDPEPAAQPKAATHTMADGSVMQGSKMHAKDHGKAHGKAHGKGHGAHAPEATGPSAAARMVCSGDVVDDVSRILALPEDLEPSSAWNAPMFSCTFELEEGPLVLNVHDATAAEAGREHFETVRADLGETTPLKGIYGLGLPAYETDDGTVVFIKDGKTLRVDATALPGGLGPNDHMTQTELAYAVATSVLACWTAHA